MLGDEWRGERLHRGRQCLRRDSTCLLRCLPRPTSCEPGGLFGELHRRAALTNEVEDAVHERFARNVPVAHEPDLLQRIADDRPARAPQQGAIEIEERRLATHGRNLLLW